MTIGYHASRTLYTPCSNAFAIEGRWFFARKTLDARYLPAGFLIDAR